MYIIDYIKNIDTGTCIENWKPKQILSIGFVHVHILTFVPKQHRTFL